MKAETIQRDILRSNSFEEKSMGLAAGSEAFVFNVLRKDLYSDPIGSLIREYTVNAQDEHRKHNRTDVPIHIQVPNALCPELHIRDFAGGLTEEQVFNFFGNYGASDKRDSNVAVGFFGLGCKSAFAYTDSYIVKSFKDGICYTFNIYIDETEIGKTAKIAEERTDEANGVEIIVPVQTRDIQVFETKVISTVSHFKTTPVITGMSETPNFEIGTPIIEGEGWKFFGNGSPKVVMGEIAYPFDYNNIENLETWERNIFGSNILLYVGIGDVQVTASREALQITAKTVKALRDKVLLVKNTMISETEKAFSGCENLIEAKKLYNKLITKGEGFGRIIRGSGLVIKWKDHEITDNYIGFVDPQHTVTVYTINYKGVIKSNHARYLSCKDGEDIYFDDVTATTNVSRSRRAKTVFSNGIREFYLVATTNKKELETVLGTPINVLKSFEAVVPTLPPTKSGYGAGVDVAKRAKHTSKVFVLNVAKLNGHYGVASEVWDVKEVENLKGVYVTIDRFKPTNSKSIYDLSDLQTALSRLKKAGMPINIPIYGIKVGADAGNLIKLDDWIDYKISKNTYLLEKKRITDAFTNSMYDIVNAGELDVAKLSKNSLAKIYATEYNKFAKVRKEANQSGCLRVFQYAKVTPDSDETLENLNKEFVAKYPLLRFISDDCYKKPEVITYIHEQDSKSDQALAGRGAS